MQTISVCIVTKNEENNITDCLESIAWADEIVVIDSQSTDSTVDICRRYTDKILITEWQGCGPQKKQVCEMASCDWILMLDADERVSPELQQEIQDLLRDPPEPSKYHGYHIPFRSHFCGQPMYFGDLLNEKHLRLFRRKYGIVIPRLVHFRIEVSGNVGKMCGKIIHNSFQNLSSVIQKMNIYSTDGAQHKFNQGKRSNFWNAIGHGLFAFMRGYFLKLGFLDGKAGFMLAFATAEGSYYRYIKLIELYAKQDT